MAKKKKSAKSSQPKKTVTEPPFPISEVVSTELVSDKLDSHSLLNIPAPENNVTITLIDEEKESKLPTNQNDTTLDFSLTMKVTIPNPIAYIRDSKPPITSREVYLPSQTKQWIFSISHNFGNQKNLFHRENFMSLQVDFINDTNESFRYAIVSIEFLNDESHAHTFTSTPLLFDISCTSFRLSNVISLYSIFYDRGQLLKDGSFTFIIHIRPAPLDTLSLETQFILCCRQNNVNKVREYLDRVDVNCVSSLFSQRANSFMDGATAFIAAVNDHANQVAEELIKYPTMDITLTNANFENALHRACWSNNFEIVDTLITEKCPINDGNLSGMTPLMIAAMMGHIQCVERLLAFSDCNCKDYEGNTALHYACIQNHEEVVRMLVSAGVNVHATNLNKRSAINYTDNPSIHCIIITGNRLQSLETQSISPFICNKPFQCDRIMNLFTIGYTLMKFVASEKAVFPVYPFELLEPAERLTLTEKFNDCVLKSAAQMEHNILNESLYFACLYILTQGVRSNPSYKQDLSKDELELRTMILNAYEERYGENLDDKGINAKTAQASLFTTIIDLLLLSFISHYSIKKALFLNKADLLSIHNTSSSYPMINESYFVTLPMTRYDEPYLQHLIKTKQSPQQVDYHSNIVGSILMLLSPVKLKPPIEVSIGIESTRLHAQYQYITKRNITPYQPYRTTTAQTLFEQNSNALMGLKTLEFTQFWELLSMDRKRLILCLSLKDLSIHIRENPYWYSFRYFLNNWESLLEKSGPVHFEHNQENVYIDEKNINSEMINTLIVTACDFNKLMTPTKTSCNLYKEVWAGEAKSMEELVTLRFGMFLNWLFCDNIIREYQYHKDVEEANRNAAMVLNENLNEMEKSKSKKNKRNKKKKEIAIPPPKEVPVKETPAKEVPMKEEYNIKCDFSLKAILDIIQQEIQLIKPSSFERKTAPLSTPSNSVVVTEKKERAVRKEAVRINKFLQGDKRDTAGVFTEKKEETQTEETTVHSFRSLLHSSSRLFSPIPSSPYVTPESGEAFDCSYASILPSLTTFQVRTDMSMMESSDECSTPKPVTPKEMERKDNRTVVTSANQSRLTPSQIFQYTVQQQLNEDGKAINNTNYRQTSIPRGDQVYAYEPPDMNYELEMFSMTTNPDYSYPRHYNMNGDFSGEYIYKRM